MNRTSDFIAEQIICDQQVENLIGHLSLENQAQVIQQAVIQLGDNINDETYLIKLEELINNW